MTLVCAAPVYSCQWEAVHGVACSPGSKDVAGRARGQPCRHRRRHSITFADPVSPISLTKTDSPDPVASGAELTYTITAVNTGGAKVSNVVLTDQVNGIGGIGNPPQFVLTSTRGSCTQNVNLIACNAGTIEGGGTWVVTIRGIVTAASGTTINTTASVTGTKSAQNSTTTATATTIVSGGGGTALPDLTIAKTGPTSVAVSSPMIYTLTVTRHRECDRHQGVRHPAVRGVQRVVLDDEPL